MSYRDALPSAFATTWMASNTSRWNGEIGRVLRRMASSPAAFPGAPATALLGFASASSPQEDTGQRTPAGTVPNPFFRELGFWGTEGGVTFVGPTARACIANPNRSGCVFGPSPDPNPRGRYANYARWASHPYVMRGDMLGQAASVAPHAWYDYSQQTAVGLVNLRWHANQVASRLPSGARATGPGTLWGVALAFVGWSAGDPRAAGHIARFANELSQVPERERLGALCWYYARAYLRGTQSFVRTPRSYDNPTFMLVRLLHKLGAGEGVQRAARLDPSWFDLGLGSVGPAVIDVLTRVAYGAALPASRDLEAPATFRPAGDVAEAPPLALPPPEMPFFDPSEDKGVLDLPGDNAEEYLDAMTRSWLRTYGPEAYKRIMVRLNNGGR